MTDDIDILPLGTIMPFADREFVPDNWEPFDGQIILRHWNPELHDRISNVTEVWEAMGGKYDQDWVVLPYVTSFRQANIMAYGEAAQGLGEIPMVIAIKIARKEVLEQD